MTLTKFSCRMLLGVLLLLLLDGRVVRSQYGVGQVMQSVGPMGMRETQVQRGPMGNVVRTTYVQQPMINPMGAMVPMMNSGYMFRKKRSSEAGISSWRRDH